MNNIIYIGIDNGVSGSLGILEQGKEPRYLKMPVWKDLNYTKTKKFIHRVNTVRLNILLKDYPHDYTMVIVERPMINPMRFQASISAARALEATLIVLGQGMFPYKFIDSKEWQKVMLPKGLKTNELKIASLYVGKRLFPNVDFEGFKDADSLLIAKWAQQMNL